MTDASPLSADRLHISLSPGDEIAELDSLQTPITTFTALLNAAHSVEVDTPATRTNEAVPQLDVSVIQRRLRNRVSCRKTRLKRKLNQHALEVLARNRQKRHEYLTQLAHELGVGRDNVNAQISSSSHYDELFRELAARSLHYALVDQMYTGWLDDGNDQVTTRVLAVTTEMKQNSEQVASLPTRRPKRQRRESDKDVSTVLQSDSAAPQASLLEQWRPIVDGLQNVDLTLYRMRETDLGAGVFDRHCYWKFVSVSSANVQQDGEIAAVAVSGVTRLRFHGRHVHEINISVGRRENNASFDFDASLSIAYNPYTSTKSESDSTEC